MAAQRAATVTHPYGAYELKLLYTHHLFFGLSFGIGLLLACIVIYFGFTRLKSVGPKVTGIHVSIDDIHPPTLLPKLRSGVIPIRPAIEKNAVPVPVPDRKVDPNQVISEQTTLSQEQNPVFENPQHEEIVVNDPPAELTEPEPDMNKPIFVEIEPRVIRSVIPEYPEIARRSGIEGKVIVKALVDKEGKIKKAAVIFSDSDIFNQPAIDAADQYLFTPAMMNNGPVRVWVSLRFEFKLR